MFEHTQAFKNRGDKLEPTKFSNKGKLLWHKEHRDVSEEIMKSPLGESYAQSLYASVSRTSEDQEEIDPSADLDKKNEYLENVMKAYDPIREKELELKWKLHAKKAVILDELSKDRYGSV